MSTVSIVRVNNSLEKAITEAMELVNWRDKIHGRVVIKPNMGNLTYKPAIITRTDIVHCVVKLIRPHIDEVIVGESDGAHYSCNEAFIRTGMKDAVESAGGRIVNFSRDVQVPVKVNGLYWKEVPLPETIVTADTFISMPVIKTHEVTLMTCALKNQFGCIANKHRCLYHNHLHEIIADINLAIKPDLVVTDGTDCMEGNGPIHGPVKKLGIIVASDNAVANDMVVSRIMKIPYWEVRHIVNAINLRVGDWPRVIRGVPLDEFDDVAFELTQLDMIAKILIKVTANPLLCKTLLLSPLFPLLKKITWFYRGLRGVKART